VTGAATWVAYCDVCRNFTFTPTQTTTCVHCGATIRTQEATPLPTPPPPPPAPAPNETPLDLDAIERYARLTASPSDEAPGIAPFLAHDVLRLVKHARHLRAELDTLALLVPGVLDAGAPEAATETATPEAILGRVRMYGVACSNYADTKRRGDNGIYTAEQDAAIAEGYFAQIERAVAVLAARRLTAERDTAIPIQEHDE
jgi:hypothetical protein